MKMERHDNYSCHFKERACYCFLMKLSFKCIFLIRHVFCKMQVHNMQNSYSKCKYFINSTWMEQNKNINASFHGLFLKEAFHNSRFARYHFHHQQGAIKKKCSISALFENSSARRVSFSKVVHNIISNSRNSTKSIYSNRLAVSERAW